MGATIKKILITGGAGFIGSNLVDALISAGHNVRIADNFSTGFQEFVEHNKSSAALEIVKIDLVDEQACSQVLAGCDVVYHLATTTTRHATKPCSNTKLIRGMPKTWCA